MTREILIATDEMGRQTRYRLDLFEEGEHWTSTLAKLNSRGEPEAVAVAPRFYGTTAEQARRRMVGTLENQYDDVRVAQPA